MTRIKTMILAAVAVSAVMATAGSGTAAATPTTFCNVEETVNGVPICAPQNQYPAGTVLHAVLEEGTKLVIETPLGKAECKKSTLKVTTEQQTAMPLGAIVNAFSFAECGAFVVNTVALGTLDIEIIDIPVWTHNGTLTFTGTQIKVKKGEAECIYAPGHAGVLTGGAMATIDLAGNLTQVGGNEKCLPGNGFWKGSYTVLKPEPLWIGM